MKRRGNNEGSIFKIFDKDGVLRGYKGAITIVDPRTGRSVRKWAQAKERGAVVAKFDALKLKAKTGGSLKASNLTVAEYLNQWLSEYVATTHEPLTYRGYESQVRVYLIPKIGSIKLDRLTAMDVKRCLDAASARGLSSTTVRNIAAALKSALTAAKEQFQYITHNVALDAPTPKRRKFHAKMLTFDQARILLNEAKGNRYEAMIVLGLLMGMRRGEVLGLRWSDVDFVKRRLHVRNTLQRVLGSCITQRNPTKGVVENYVKTEKSDRRLPMPKYVVDVLQRRKLIQQQERLNAGRKWIEDGDFVLTSRHGKRVQLEQPLERLTEMLEAAELPHIRFHDLRHSTASILVAMGVPMKVVQEILGHSNFQITSDLYTHLMPTAMDEAMQVMDTLFSGPEVPTAPKTAPKTVAEIVAAQPKVMIQ